MCNSINQNNTCWQVSKVRTCYSSYIKDCCYFSHALYGWQPSDRSSILGQRLSIRTHQSDQNGSISSSRAERRVRDQEQLRKNTRKCYGPKEKNVLKTEPLQNRKSTDLDLLKVEISVSSQNQMDINLVFTKMNLRNKRRSKEPTWPFLLLPL